MLEGGELWRRKEKADGEEDEGLRMGGPSRIPNLCIRNLWSETKIIIFIGAIEFNIYCLYQGLQNGNSKLENLG